MSGWQQGEPPDDGFYLVFAPSADPERPLIAMAFWSSKESRWELVLKYWAEAITHWQELPDPPQEEEHAD